MKKILIATLVFALAGCAELRVLEYRAAQPESHGTAKLVKDWFGEPYDKDTDWPDAPRPHYCQFDNGIIMEQGFVLCPDTL